MKVQSQISPQILSRYVGTYVEQRPYWRSVQIGGGPVASGRTVLITVADGKLVGDMDERGPQVLVATSDTGLACSSSTVVPGGCS